jgi:hypothetical protein
LQKSRKEKPPPQPVEPSPANVARVEPSIGVQCPSHEATGLYVYPPDCKFYVTCWNGRAVLQPCAPGTLFSPETLECDFPNKVKCYGGSEELGLRKEAKEIGQSVGGSAIFTEIPGFSYRAAPLHFYN